MVQREDLAACGRVYVGTSVCFRVSVFLCMCGINPSLFREGDTRMSCLIIVRALVYVVCFRSRVLTLGLSLVCIPLYLTRLSSCFRLWSNVDTSGAIARTEVLICPVSFVCITPPLPCCSPERVSPGETQLCLGDGPPFRPPVGQPGQEPAYPAFLSS